MGDDETFDKDVAVYAFNSPETQGSANPLFMNTRAFNVSTQDYKHLKTHKNYKEELELSARGSQSPLQSKMSLKQRDSRLNDLSKMLSQFESQSAADYQSIRNAQKVQSPPNKLLKNVNTSLLDSQILKANLSKTPLKDQ